MHHPAFTTLCAPIASPRPLRTIHNHPISRRAAALRHHRTAFLGRCPLAIPSAPHPSAPHPAAPPSALPRAPSMALSRAVVAGGTGFVGSRLVAALAAKGTKVTVLTRSPASAGPLPATAVARAWAPDAPAAAAAAAPDWHSDLAGADLVVNLCGSPVVARWDRAGREEILESRLSSTRALAGAIASLPPPQRPKCFVSASAVGYYGVSAAAEFDEESSPARDDFLADVCVRWEEAALALMQAVPETRTVVVRIGVVMGVGGGALARMLPAFQYFVGGAIGSGEQWVSWVHIDDLVKLIIEAGENEAMRGVYNGTAPRPVRMKELSQALADALNRPNLLPVPGFVLKAALGEASSVVLDGQKVLPKRLLEAGFKFEYEDVQSAMEAVAQEA